MQPPSSPPDSVQTAQILLRIYEELLAFYGPQSWWPSRSGSPWEIMLGAVLTQRTSWLNVERALDNIETAWGIEGLTIPGRVLAAGERELVELVRPAGHFTSKPRKLKGLARYVVEAGGIEGLVNSVAPTPQLRADLLSLWGIGPETADAILLYALGRAVFVADAYALRLTSRWGLLPPTANYSAIQALFMLNLPHDAALFNEYHALIVEHGKRTCRPRPRCSVCPLNQVLSISVGLEEVQGWRCPKEYVTQEVRT